MDYYKSGIAQKRSHASDWILMNNVGRSMEPQRNIAPDEAKGWLYFQLNRMYQALPSLVKKPIDLFVFGLSPDIPISLTTVFKDADYRKTFFWSWFFTVISCFGVTALFCHFAGTLSGNDTNRLYFLDDWINIFNYIVVCPLYVGFDAVLIGICIAGAADLKAFANELLPQTSSSMLPKMKTPGVIFVSLLISCGFTVQYIKESLDPSVYPRAYWSVQEVSADGIRLLGSIGIYYSLLNFVLLFISVLALLMYFGVFASVIQIGKALSSTDNQSSLTIEHLKRRLHNFTMAYIVGKILTAIYMLNAFTWKWERPQDSFNIIIMGAILSFFGVFFISIPRYYIELEWFQLKIRRSRLQGVADLITYDDIRPLPVKLIAHFLDVIIVGGFITAFWTS